MYSIEPINGEKEILKLTKHDKFFNSLPTYDDWMVVLKDYFIFCIENEHVRLSDNLEFLSYVFKHGDLNNKELKLLLIDKSSILIHNINSDDIKFKYVGEDEKYSLNLPLTALLSDVVVTEKNNEDLKAFLLVPTERVTLPDDADIVYLLNTFNIHTLIIINSIINLKKLVKINVEEFIKREELQNDKMFFPIFEEEENGLINNLIINLVNKSNLNALIINLNHLTNAYYFSDVIFKKKFIPVVKCRISNETIPSMYDTNKILTVLFKKNIDFENDVLFFSMILNFTDAMFFREISPKEIIKNYKNILTNKEQYELLNLYKNLNYFKTLEKKQKNS